MSRSSLEKQTMRQMGQHILPAAYSAPGQPMPPGYMYPPGVGPLLPGLHPMMSVDPVTGQPIAPIIRGDDEDFDDPQHKSNALPMHGNSSTFHINTLLYNNIMENPYFHALYQLRTYHEVIDEIKRSVKHVEPWQTGTARFPSSAFCLLVKFMVLKLTLKQMNGLLGMRNSPYVRCIGLLYLRYTCNPADLFKWFEPHLDDQEAFQPSSDKSLTMSMGEYCIKLLTDMQYFGTTLPRIPVPIERKMKVLLLLREEKLKRRQVNLKHINMGRLKPGSKVKAIYSDEENEPAWYDAVIEGEEEGQEERQGPRRFWVTFPEYGNQELVDLGDIDMVEKEEERGKERRRSGSRGERERERNRGHRGESRERERNRDRDRDRERDRDRGERRKDSRSRSRDRSRERERDRGRGRRSRSPPRGRSPSPSPSKQSTSTSSLLQRVLESERKASAAVGKNYAQRPASYKGSLSLKLDRYTARRQSPSPVRGERRERRRSRSPVRSTEEGKESKEGMTAEQLERIKRLKERYGDASAGTS